MKPEPTIIVLHLRPAPGNWQAPPDRRLARLLKCMLRAYGWRCIGAREVLPDAAEPTQRTPEAKPTKESTGNA
jgi:hypothetical protein